MNKPTRLRVYNPAVSRLFCAIALLFGASAAHDPQPYLSSELVFLKPGVRLETEEREVRRVLAQRNMRIVSRSSQPEYIALGAASRDDRQSAVRVISPRGVVIAEDAALDDLFAPAKIILLEHFVGTIHDYTLIASARLPKGREIGCVTVHRLLPDGSAVECVLDTGLLGSRACVANLAQGRTGHLRATIAWPNLHAIVTPQLDVELAFADAPIGQPPPAIPVIKLREQGEWLDEARTHLQTLRLARASFSHRHAAGVARAALARVAGEQIGAQQAAYRHAVARVLPGSPESEVVADTLAHIERGWTDPPPPPDPDAPSPDGTIAPSESDMIIIDPELVEPH